MSENSDYRITAMLDGAGQAMNGALHRRGFFFRDVEAWATAQQRADELNRRLAEEMKRRATEMDSTCRDIILAEAMLAAFHQIDSFRTVTQQGNGGTFDAIDKSIRDLRSGGASDSLQAAARGLQERIETLASHAQNTLCQMENEVLLEIMSRSLGSLGYITERQGDYLKATSGQTCVWAESKPWGELSLDFSGFSGLSCLEEIRRVEGQLRRNGIVMSRVATERHGRPEGGTLAGNAAALFPVFRTTDWLPAGQAMQRRKMTTGG